MTRKPGWVVLTCEDLDFVDHERLGQLSVSFDDSQLVSVDGELIVGIARHRHKTESVAPVSLDIDNCDVSLWSARTSTFAVDQGRVGKRRPLNRGCL